MTYKSASLAQSLLYMKMILYKQNPKNLRKETYNEVVFKIELISGKDFCEDLDSVENLWQLCDV